MTQILEVARKVETACWCGGTTVMVPVQWLTEARTGSCGPDCGPGCPLKADNTDSFDEATKDVARDGKKTKMRRFDPSRYDARVDSSLGYTDGTATRDAHPHAVILETVTVGSDSPVLCPCGCAEAPRSKGAVFGMGHDARLRGKLARARAASAQVVLTDQNKDVREVVDPLELAARFSTAKLDWKVSVEESASRAGERGVNAAASDAAILARALGPQVGDTKVIKVGRWEKTGHVVAVYEDSQGVLYEYTDGSGVTRQAREDADGKVRPVKAS